MPAPKKAKIHRGGRGVPRREEQGSGVEDRRFPEPRTPNPNCLCIVNPAPSNAGVAQAGYVCSIIGLILGGITTLCGCGYIVILAVLAIGIAGGAAQGVQ